MTTRDLSSTLADAQPAPAGAALPAEGARRPDVGFHLIWLAISAAVVLLAALLSVEEGTKVILPLINQPLPESCWLRRWFALPCPGCGLTRCFISLAHGDPAAAWGYNPAGLYLFALVLLQLPYRAAQLWRIRRGLPELDYGWLGYASIWLVPVLLFAQWFEKLRALW